MRSHHAFRRLRMQSPAPFFGIADGVISTGMSAEATWPIQEAPGGEANPTDAPTTDPARQPSDNVPTTADESPTSAPATNPVPQSITTGEPSVETATTPTEIGQAASVEAAESNGGVVTL